MMSSEAEYYEFRVRGQLNNYWQAWFEGLTLTTVENGETLITGPIRDQAALHGVLAKIRDLGLHLISVVQIDPGTERHGVKGENIMTNKHNTQISHPLPKPNLALKHLAVLVGEWNMVLSIPTEPPTILPGLWATFEWLEGGFFLVWRWGPARPDFPAALSLIGYDDSTEVYTMHYFDSCGVSRLLEVSLSDGVWKVWRTSLDFSQRFTATFSDKGQTVTGTWEKSSDGMHWAHDFDMIFTKVT